MYNKQDRITALGIMSGTSLDGLDFALAEFGKNGEKWNFRLLSTETISYNLTWKKKLINAAKLSGIKLTKLNLEYGKHIGEQASGFLNKSKIRPEIIASHGHTVFHQPELGFTLQIGSGYEIAVQTGITTISDFRSMDVALGGQGAPLVPVGDKLLFSDYEYCLNLGGFSNVSFDEKKKRIAFDICPVNIILNDFAEKQGLPYDINGDLGRKGKINTQLLNDLNALPYYQQKPPKSLGREWLENEFGTVLEKYNINDFDKLRTIYEHIAIQTGKIGENGKLLVTGGGAFNTFLMQRIKANSSLEIILPNKQLIAFKEALIFAFLGVLKYLGEINCWASVTGAKRDSSGGIITNCG